jgi:hypothetical protein
MVAVEAEQQQQGSSGVATAGSAVVALTMRGQWQQRSGSAVVFVSA